MTAKLGIISFVFIEVVKTKHWPQRPKISVWTRDNIEIHDKVHIMMIYFRIIYVNMRVNYIDMHNYHHSMQVIY